MRLLVSVLIVFGFLPTANAAAPEVNLVGVSSGTIQDAVRMLNGEGQWRAESSAQFVKIDIRFSQPPSFSRIEVQSCGTPFSDGAHIFVNFDDSSLFCEGGRDVLGFNFSKPVENARSLTLNFRYNKSLCVSAIRFLKDGKVTKISAKFLQEPISGSVLALHDGRLDTSWSLDETDRAAEFKFETERKIDRIRVWNGDQRSSGLFKKSPRVKSLALFADKQREVVTLKDTPDAQILELENSIKGKVIRLLVEEAYGGAITAAKMSEVQIGEDDSFVATDTLSLLKEKADSLKASFAGAKLDGILDKNLVVNEDNAKWSIRVRTDGSFFMRGHTENLQRSRNFTYLGRYSVAHADKKGVKLAVEGFISILPLELDASTCGRDCGGNPGPEPVFIRDEVSFGAGKNGLIFVRDEGPRKARGLEFHTLKAKIAKESE